MAFRSKGTQQVPVPSGTTVVSNVQTDGSSVVTPGGYNESLSGGYQYTVVASAATTVSKNAPGRLCKLHCLPGGTLGTVTVYDNASAGSGQALYGPYTPIPGTHVEVQLPSSLGCTVVTAAATNMLVAIE